MNITDQTYRPNSANTLPENHPNSAVDTGRSAITHTHTSDPKSLQLSAVQSCLYYVIKPLLHIPKFSPMWMAITNCLDVSLEKLIVLTLSRPYETVQIPLTSLHHSDDQLVDFDQPLNVYHFLPHSTAQTSQAQPTISTPEKHLILIPGGGYLFGPSHQFHTSVAQFTEEGFHVWVPNYTRLPHGKGEATSRYNLLEMHALHHHLEKSLGIDAKAIGFSGDSAGGEVLLRFMKYQATLGQPIQSPFNLVSPVHLERLEPVELEGFDAANECFLPTHQLIDLKTALNHQPVASLLMERVDREVQGDRGNSQEGVENYKGTGPVRIAIAKGELVSGPALKTYHEMRADQLDVQLVENEHSFHSAETLPFSPEQSRYLTESVTWLQGAMARESR